MVIKVKKIKLKNKKTEREREEEDKNIMILISKYKLVGKRGPHKEIMEGSNPHGGYILEDQGNQLRNQLRDRWTNHYSKNEGNG